MTEYRDSDGRPITYTNAQGQPITEAEVAWLEAETKKMMRRGEALSMLMPYLTQGLGEVPVGDVPSRLSGADSGRLKRILEGQPWLEFLLQTQQSAMANIDPHQPFLAYMLDQIPAEDRAQLEADT